jgi:pimeloyl-ACP methyl ester carboxylesterase
MRIEVNGHGLQVEQSGPPSGRPLVLLHHGLGSIVSWHKQAPALAEAGYFVTAYDRWGYGGSDPRPSLDAPLFQQDMADLAALIRQLGLEEPVLIGHSDGGTIAVYMAACCPERVGGLAVIAAHIYIEEKMVPAILAVQKTFQEDARFRQGLRRLHADKTEAVFSNWFEGWLKEEHLTWDIRPLVGRITCPAWVVQGEADEHATPQQARDLAAGIPGAQLWLAEGAGHMLPQDQAENFNRRLFGFLSGLPDRKEKNKNV